VPPLNKSRLVVTNSADPERSASRLTVRSCRNTRCRSIAATWRDTRLPPTTFLEPHTSLGKRDIVVAVARHTGDPRPVLAVHTRRVLTSGQGPGYHRSPDSIGHCSSLAASSRPITAAARELENECPLSQVQNCEKLPGRLCSTASRASRNAKGSSLARVAGAEHARTASHVENGL